MREVVCAAIFEELKILLVRKEKDKKESWILPGGTKKPGEADDECLAREIKEELSGTEIVNVKYYRSFEGTSPHIGDTVQARVYFADINGKLNKPSAEISMCEFVSDFAAYNLSDITEKIIDSLKKDGYLENPK